jgi:hypothetical protein
MDQSYPPTNKENVLSEDTATVILKYKQQSLVDGYRVRQMQAPDNLFVHVNYVVDAFKECEEFTFAENAIKYAEKLEEENPTEYGISTFHKYRNRTWLQIEQHFDPKYTSQKLPGSTQP